VPSHGQTGLNNLQKIKINVVVKVVWAMGLLDNGGGAVTIHYTGWAKNGTNINQFSKILKDGSQFTASAILFKLSSKLFRPNRSLKCRKFILQNNV